LEYNHIDDARPISALPKLEILNIVTGQSTDSPATRNCQERRCCHA